MLKEYKRYIKDVATVLCISYSDTEPKLDKKKFKRFSLNAIKNYTKFRLKLMSNETICKLEHEAIKSVVKSTIRSVSKKYNVTYNDTLDDVIDKISEEVLMYVHFKRVDLFTTCLEWSEDEINKIEN